MSVINRAKNPLKFSIHKSHIEISEWLDHENEVDDIERRVVEVEPRPIEEMVYVHWEVVER